MIVGARSSLRDAYRAVRRGLRRVKAMRYPVTGTAIREALTGFVVREIVFVHSSLSACGHVVGGAATAMEALRSWCGAGTLALPTHTYCYPDEDGNVPIFDPTTTQSVLGAITNFYWQSAGVLRSLHPSHSLAARGPAAAALIANHEKCYTPCGTGTPYERLLQWDAGVLMFGATLDSYTLFHTAEDAANVSYLYYPKSYVLKVATQSGVEDVPMRRQDMTVQRRFGAVDVWLEQKGLLQRRALGRGELLYIPSAAAAHRALLDVLKTEPLFLTTAYDDQSPVKH